MEHLPGGIDRRHLQVLFGPKVRKEAALAHADVLSEPGDRKAVEPLDRGELGRRAQDRLAASGPICPLPTAVGFHIRGEVRIHTNNVARPVVL